MTINSQKPIPTSLRIPSDLDTGLEKIMVREHLKKTAVIIKAIEHWINIDGKITEKVNYDEQLNKMGENYTSLQLLLKEQNETINGLKDELTELRKIMGQQNIIIDNLLTRIPREK